MLTPKIYFPNLSTKRNFSKLLKYIVKLEISCESESYVLQYILNQDFTRQIILIKIDKIKLENNLITVILTTRHGSYGFSVSDFESNGWNKGMTIEDKQSSVWQDLHHKIRG